MSRRYSTGAARIFGEKSKNFLTGKKAVRRYEESREEAVADRAKRDREKYENLLYELKKEKDAMLDFPTFFLRFLSSVSESEELSRFVRKRDPSCSLPEGYSDVIQNHYTRKLWQSPSVAKSFGRKDIPSLVAGALFAYVAIYMASPVLADDAVSYIACEETMRSYGRNLKSLFPDIPIDVIECEYSFPRNVFTDGVLSAPSGYSKDYRKVKRTALGIERHVKEKGAAVRKLNLAANMANSQYYERERLLVLGYEEARNVEAEIDAMTHFRCHGEKVTPLCEGSCKEILSISTSCPEVGREIESAFGEPKKVIRIQKRLLDHEGKPILVSELEYKTDVCYDLDVFFQMFRTADHKPYALVYWPCVRDTGVDRGLHSRAEIKETLEESGIGIIELSRSDFRAMAANFVQPRSGQIAFSRPITKKLSSSLEGIGMEVRQPISEAKSVGVTTGRERVGYGLHCLLTENPPPPTAVKSLEAGSLHDKTPGGREGL
jgi:hypothetical protein